MGYSVIDDVLYVTCIFFVCICKQISDIESKIGRRGKELSNDVKDIAHKLFEVGKTIDHVSNTLHIPRSTVWSLKKRFERWGSIENTPRRGRTPLGDSKGL